MALLVVELLLPILHVVAEVDLFRRPERGLGFFVHRPDISVFDREEHEAVRVLHQ